MEDRRFIKPAEGLDIRDPDAGHRPLPPHGAGVVWSGHWQRRLDDGDVETTSKTAIAAAEKAGGKDLAVEKGDAK